MLLVSNPQKQFHDVCIYFSKFLGPFMIAENDWCPMYRKICFTISATFKTRWLDPSCLLGAATLWPIPVQEGFGRCLFLAGPLPCQGLLSSEAEPATPWYSFIFHRGITCESTTGKSGERRRWRGMPWKHFWMIFTLFHQIYKMLFYLFSCFSDSSLHTE